MNRTEKAAEIDRLKERFSGAMLAILTDYKGLSVAKLTDLRRKLRANQATYKVVKNRLAKIAVKDTPLGELGSHFVGTTAIALSKTNPTGPAKVLIDYAKTEELLKIKAGYLDGKIIGINEISSLANLPSKEELIAKLLGSLNAPATNLVSVLSQIPRQLVTVLSAIRDQKENKLQT
ncbi:MAG: 50S ribosomal protein L10 [Deltaproteobacteria bacterium]|nr:50S ribosomal protein L10 [Deltaproteobacteria bacterium]